MNASELSRALSAHAETVCRHYLPNGRKNGRYWVCGDVRGAKGKSMHVRLAPPGTPGKWTDEATGEHGDLLDIVRASTNACELRDAMVEAHRFLALPVHPRTPLHPAEPNPRARTAHATHRIWSQALPIAGTHAEAYLRHRRIVVSQLPSLRFHPSLMHRDETNRRRLPGIVAAVVDNNDAFTGIHRTWLDPREPDKAKLREPRKALGAIHRNAVRFNNTAAPSILIVGEGLETVLSVVTALPSIPAAAALSAAHLGGFEPPPHVRRLLIARDADRDGADAALRLRRHCERTGIEAVVVEPRHGDFNDDLVELGPDAVADAFMPHIDATAR